MNGFNENQKKWGLTGLLVAVLGFSLSAPIQQQLHALDLASTAANCDMSSGREETVIDSKGNGHKIRYFKCDNEETNVFYPVALEGGNCKDCMSSKILKSNFDDAKSVEAALRKSLASSVSEPRKEDEKPVDDRDDRVRRAGDALDRILDICGKKKKEDSALANCYSREFLNVLKRKKDLDVSDANSWYDGNLKPLLRKMLRNYADGSTDYQDVASMIKDLEADLPSAYKRIRDSLKDLIKDGVQEYANKLRKDRIEAITARSQADMYDNEAKRLQQMDPSSAMMYSQMAMQQRAQAMQLEQRNLMEKNFLSTSLVPSLFDGARLGLLDAVTNNFVDQSYMNATLQAIRTNAMSSVTFGSSQINPTEVMILPINGSTIGVNNGLGLGLNNGLNNGVNTNYLSGYGPGTVGTNTIGLNGQPTLINGQVGGVQVRAVRGGTVTVPLQRNPNRTIFQQF